ncbi:MAG: hypothetical protein JSS75_13235 [Bacteroidetes bacterium]|nr:hypothetical protein [Bacteroidota bacterium]
MKPLLLLLLLGTVLAGCVTRTELDSYTITVRDTSYRARVRNVPGDDNGVIFPSSRLTSVHNGTISYDSTYERKYPDFLRYGLFEFGGFITGASGPGLGAGLLGVYTLLDSNEIKSLAAPRENSMFKGRLVRVLPLEYRLRWFDDAPNWTIGWSAYESIAQNTDSSNTLTSVGTNLYIRKRYWFRDHAPFLFASPFFGISLYPSLYVNLGGELTFGSFGGFNIRGYLGLASGFTWQGALPQGATAHSITTVYTGLGVSALDFVNKVSETEHEWIDYLHSAVEVSAVDVDLYYGTAGYSNLFSKNVSLPFTGVGVQVATAHFPLGILNGKFWAGTSLFKFFALGYDQALMSVLPLRFGYREYLIAEDLTVEPFIEANYYPSSFINLGARLKLNTFRDITVGINAGYAAGSSGAFYPRIFTNNASVIRGELSSFYLGLSLGLKDRYNTPERVHQLERINEQW